MKIVIICAVLLFCYPGTPAFTQSDGFVRKVEQSFGINQNLVNGTLYFNQHLRSQGHPYLLDDVFEKGVLEISGSLYPDVSLKYNIFRQQLELEYSEFSGAPGRIIVVSEHVDQFSLGGFHFVRKRSEDTDLFYQHVETANFSCYVQWSKKLIPVKTSTTIDEKFTKARPVFQLYIDKGLLEVRSKKSFSACFPEDQQKEIKKLLGRSRFSFRNASPAEIVITMQAVSNLVNKESEP